MKKVWIFQTGEPIHFDQVQLRPMRAMNLTDKLLKKNCVVTVWTANFSHQFKEKRFKTKTVKAYKNFTIRYIESPGYSENISLARLFDHLILGLNLFFALLKEKERPDIAFVGFPPIEFAFFASFWLNLKRVPYVIDVKDQWPDIFISTLKGIKRKIIKFLLLPYFLMSIYSMKNATAFCSMSNKFINWIHRFANITKIKKSIAVPLSSNTFSCSNNALFSAKYLKQNKLSADTINILFIGSLSHIFDFDTVIKCMILAKQKKLKIKLILCGLGHQHQKLKTIAEEHRLDILFIGWVSPKEIIALSSISSVAIAPYKNTPDFLASIPNKIADYLSLGLPIFSPLGGEVKRLIINKRAGFFYRQRDYKELLKKIIFISKHKAARDKIYENNINLFNQKFNSDQAYNDLAKFLIELA